MCQKSLYQTRPQVGLVFFTCEHKRTCTFEWWCVALPPMATRTDLEQAVGQEAAKALLEQVRLPYEVRRAEDLLWPAPIDGKPASVFVCVATRPRERHLYAHLAPNALLQKLGVIPTTSHEHEAA